MNLANGNIPGNLPDETSTLDSILEELTYKLKSYPISTDELKKNAKNSKII